MINNKKKKKKSLVNINNDMEQKGSSTIVTLIIFSHLAGSCVPIQDYNTLISKYQECLKEKEELQKK